MNRLILLAAIAVCMLPAINSASAAEPIVRTIYDIPDRSQDEVSRVREVSVSDNQPVRIILNYKDGRHKIRQFVEGQLAREVEQSRDGTLRTIRWKNAKKVEEQVTKNGVTDIRGYREDGMLLYTTSRSMMGESVSTYYDKTGALRLTRTFQRTGRMVVVVVDNKGNELYKQTWVAGIGGYVLLQVEEKTAVGIRRLTLRGPDVATADYLKSDGSVLKTEQGNALSEPVDRSRFEEAGGQDDPTVPPRRQINRISP